MKPNNRPSRRDNEDIIFGTRAVIEAVRAGKEINKILVQKGLHNELFNDLKEELKGTDVQLKTVPQEFLNKFSGKNHQGIIAFVSPVHYYKLDEILPAVFEEGKIPLVLILDRITDVRNLCAICRSAECMGVHAVVVPSRGGATITSDAMKTSAGALNKIPVCREENLKHTIHFLSASGLQVICCTEKTEQLLQDTDLTIPTAIILGSEEDGISPEYLKLSDKKVKIPMQGTIESLNVSVSAGIVLYEVVRQRTNVN